MTLVHPNPCKRVLVELAQFRYLFGNTKYCSALTRPSPIADERILFLGFGDLRNAWATCGAATAGTPLHIDLVDIVPVNVARAVLLDHCAELVDPASDADMHFLWCVWYCAALPPRFAARLRSELHALLADDEAFSRRFGRAEDAAAVRLVLELWQTMALPPLAAVVADRQRHLTRWMPRRDAQASSSDQSSPSPAYITHLQREYAHTVASSVLGPAAATAGTASTAVTDECQRYVATGSLHPAGVQAEADAASDWEANLTLLEPGTGQWLLHYGAHPFLSFMPLAPAELAPVARAAARGDSHAVTASCLAQLRKLVAGRRSRRPGTAAARLLFWLGDALELASSGELPPASYSVIDTSNLADHVGHLNILAVCGPLLRPHPTSSLRTASMIWTTSSENTLIGYLNAALGFPLRMAPTVLGLRLLSQPEFGRDTVLPGMPGFHAAGVEDAFVWAPVRRSAVLPAAQGDVLAALRGVAALCTGSEVKHSSQKAAKRDRCGMRLGTTLTLLHILRGAAERVAGILPEGSSGEGWWQRVAEHTATLCALDGALHMQWDALCCWCFGGGPLPVLATADVTPSPAAALMFAPQVGHTPVLAAVVIEKPTGTRGGPAAAADLAALLQLVAPLPLQQSSWLDVVRCELRGGTLHIALLLPPTAIQPGSPLFLVDVSNAPERCPIHHLPLREPALHCTPFTQPPPARLSGTSWLAAAAAAAAGAAAAVTLRGFAIKEVREEEGKYRVVLDIKNKPRSGGPSGVRCDLQSPDLLADGAAHTVMISLTSPSASAQLTLAHPVQYEGHSARVAASGCRVVVMLPKAWVWPGDEAVLGRIKVEGLQEVAYEDLGLPMSFMWGINYAMACVKRGRAAALPPAGSPDRLLTELKDSVKALFLSTAQRGPMLHRLMDAASPESKEAAITIAVYGVFALPDGRPILHLSYVDHRTALRLNPTHSRRMEAFQRFQKVLHHLHSTRCGEDSEHSQLLCEAGEVDLFRRILARNAQRLEAPKWQRDLLKPPTEWVASFLLPLYNDRTEKPDQELTDSMEHAQSVDPTGSADAGVDASHAADRARSVGEVTAPAAKPCSGCGQPCAQPQRCSRCKQVAYCSRSCQQAHWKAGHKAECRPAS